MALKQINNHGQPYEVWCIDTLSDFLKFAEERVKSDQALFRGQSEDWPLKPKIARIRCRYGSTILETEERMLSHFRRTSVGYLDAKVDLGEAWDVIAIAQHHGMATRLLDWSSNPLVGLWFAIQRPVRPGVKSSVVWALSPSQDDFLQHAGSPLLTDRVVVWEPRHVTRRISAQGGAFTVHPYSKVSKEFRALEAESRLHQAIQKVEVPVDNFTMLRYQLDRCGVNAASIFPDLDGLARHIEWFHTLLDDEACAPTPAPVRASQRRTAKRAR